jgi:hypothetical protein
MLNSVARFSSRALIYRSLPKLPAQATVRKMATLETLNAELSQQTELFNRLRVDGSEPEQLEETKKRLQDLKKQIGALKSAGGAAGKDAKKKERLLLKTPKVRST